MNSPAGQTLEIRLIDLVEIRPESSVENIPRGEIGSRTLDIVGPSDSQQPHGIRFNIFQTDEGIPDEIGRFSRYFFVGQ